MNNKTQSLYDEYVEILQKAADFNHAAAVLEWDQEVNMPAGGAQLRARQLARLSEAAHELLTCDRLGRLLQELSARSLSEIQAANVIRSWQDYETNKKLPASFVAELSLQTSAAYNAWLRARSANDFSVYMPFLDGVITLKRKEAEMLGYVEHRYNAMLDQYDKGSRVSELDRLFIDVKTKLLPLLERIRHAPQVDDQCLHLHFSRQSQWDFSLTVLKKMGFDFSRGRQDISEHPFTTSFGESDVRITTRADEFDFSNLLWSTIHEGGHALYEQGLPADQYGLPCGTYASLSIHESQSRFWENNVGRSVDFWRHAYTSLQAHFPEQLQSVQVSEFFRAINKVAPSPIRTEADELTYHFHIMIRYEIEKLIFAGEVTTAMLPELWQALYNQYLGIVRTSDLEGILQDVHWSHGSFGYFPTYSTGSFYAAQFFAAAGSHLGDLSVVIGNGHLQILLDWLRRNIHIAGRQLTSEQLCERVTGERLNVGYFFKYVDRKYAEVYP